jgi:hypothetical protein
MIREPILEGLRHVSATALIQQKAAVLERSATLHMVKSSFANQTVQPYHPLTVMCTLQLTTTETEDLVGIEVACMDRMVAGLELVGKGMVEAALAVALVWVHTVSLHPQAWLQLLLLELLPLLRLVLKHHLQVQL